MQFQNVDEWRTWKKARVLQLQRERRANMRRIDYYASPEAARIIDENTYGSEGGDMSSVISRLIEWAAGHGFKG